MSGSGIWSIYTREHLSDQSKITQQGFLISWDNIEEVPAVLTADKDQCLNVCPPAAEVCAWLSGQSMRWNLLPWDVHLSICRLSDFIRNALVQSGHQTICSWTAGSGSGRWTISQQCVCAHTYMKRCTWYHMIIFLHNLNIHRAQERSNKT